MQDELFGNQDQVKLMRRAASLWCLLAPDPAFSYYGRMVSLVDSERDVVKRLHSLTRLQGATSCQYFPAERASDLSAELNSLGMGTQRQEQIWGGAEALTASDRILRDRPMPDGLSVQVVDDSTPRQQLVALADLSLSCDVLPVPGSIMRGLSIKGVCLMAADADGEVVATASSYLANHPSNPYGSDAFWGMLATRQDWRGHGLALILGAHAIALMHERHGVTAFTSCVNAANRSSMAVCEKVGITATDWVFIGCMDPEQFGQPTITK